MKISEIIKELENIRAEHGDIEPEMYDGGCGCCSEAAKIESMDFRQSYGKSSNFILFGFTYRGVK